MSYKSYHRFQRDAILNEAVPDEVLQMAARDRLPGTGPLDTDKWLIRNETFARQMALRDTMVQASRNMVIIEKSPVSAPAQELLEMVLSTLATDKGYLIEAGQITRPDGALIKLNADTPIATLGRLVQEDLLILHSGPQGHVLTEGTLCFPSGWTFAEKAGHSLGRIHLPVESYTQDIGRRVQRLFDAIRPGKILCRANLIQHDNFHLFQPHNEADRRKTSSNPQFLRSERQCILKLPRTGAAVFSIHSYVVRQTNNKAL